MADVIAKTSASMQLICLDKSALPDLWFGLGQTPVGPAVIVASGQTLLALWLASQDAAQPLARVTQKYGGSVTRRDDALAQQWLDAAFERDGAGLTIGVSGSDFDIAVWRALCQIPKGQRWSYGELARAMGRASAARAVGSALARNIVAYLIPCHRVVRHDGSVGQFRWGSETKQALLDWEQH